MLRVRLAYSNKRNKVLKQRLKGLILKKAKKNRVLVNCEAAKEVDALVSEVLEVCIQ
jgi:hypothetical protein